MNFWQRTPRDLSQRPPLTIPQASSPLRENAELASSAPLQPEYSASSVMREEEEEEARKEEGRTSVEDWEQGDSSVGEREGVGRSMEVGKGRRGLFSLEPAQLLSLFKTIRKSTSSSAMALRDSHMHGYKHVLAAILSPYKPHPPSSWQE